jgi:polar amino acid transport system substrate-binding protein
MSVTITPGTLIVASAYPDPPFEMADGSKTGFDVDLIRAICDHLGLSLQTDRYLADNFDGVFDGLAKRSYDAVISGTTITADRSKLVLFSKPYLEFNQAVAVNRHLTPRVHSEGDLHGMVAGIQSGNTSESVAQRWVADGTIAKINYYPYDGILSALADLDSGKIGLIIKLFPVISHLVQSHPQLAVAIQVPTHEKLGIAFSRNNTRLCDDVNSALDALRGNGEFAKIQARWFPAAAKA